MTHKLLEFGIKYSELDFISMVDSEYSILFESHNFDLKDTFFWSDTTGNRFWLRFNVDVIKFNPLQNNFLTFETFTKQSILSKEQFEDIKNNFIENGKIKEIEFILAYGREYSDKSINFDTSQEIAFSKVIEMLRVIYSQK